MTQMTDRQRSFIVSLLSERVVTVKPDLDTLSTRAASDVISALLRAPKREGVRAAAPARVTRTVTVTDLGMYRTEDGTIYRVKRSRESGRLYAMRLGANGGFTYAAGTIYDLTPAHRMSLADAQAFGVETGVCCVCGALLTDPRSVERGIGPVCAGQGWW